MEELGVYISVITACVPDSRLHWARSGLGIHFTARPSAAGEEVLEIVAASAVAAGHEVHNTYGEHGNAELVNKYGFALDRCGAHV